jgi:hypothetical protein
MLAEGLDKFELAKDVSGLQRRVYAEGGTRHVFPSPFVSTHSIPCFMALSLSLIWPVDSRVDSKMFAVLTLPLKGLHCQILLLSFTFSSHRVFPYPDVYSSLVLPSGLEITVCSHQEKSALIERVISSYSYRVA